MIKTFKYRLYPTKRQAVLLHEQLREACKLYNAALQERRDAYRKCGISISCYDQTRQLKDIRADGTTALISFKPAQDVLQRVDRAFDAFFRRVKHGDKPGYPRFKSFRRYDSFTYINYGKTPQVDAEGKLILKGIGHVKVRWHRPVIGTTKTCTIKREAGRWYVSFSVEYARAEGQPSGHNAVAQKGHICRECRPWQPHEYEANSFPPADASTGLDVGLESFATMSDGEIIENPRYLKAARAHLRRAQRRLARRKHGSNRRRKAVLMLQRAYARVKQQRRHFHHVTARNLVSRFQLIGVEDLQIGNMVRSAKGTAERPGTRVRQKSGLNRSILDAGWGQFLLIMSAKAAEAGQLVIKVPARGTSQRCPCGAEVLKPLSNRWHACDVCGLSIPRDHASAMEIHRLALLQLSA